MILKNVQAFQTSGGFIEKDIIINNGVFSDQIVQEDETSIDGNGLYAIPGLVDIHFHGCMGVDFCNGNLEAIQTIADYQLSQGITSICPATMTIPSSEIYDICRIAGSYESTRGAKLVGINLEGPFISEGKKGAQKADNILLPSIDLLLEWINASKGLCKLIDIAPEVDGGLDFIRHAKDHIRISLAHTSADYDLACEAFLLGADHITHLYNAMTPLTHRAPGMVGAGADCEHVFAEIICDGIHIHPAVIRATFNMYGSHRMILISDSMEATGLVDGTYQLGGQAVTVKGKEATLKGGVIAGSVTNLMDCMRFAVKESKIPLWDAVNCASVNPAKSIGLFDTIGSLDIGKQADVLLLNDKLELIHVIQDGVLIK
ncbi:MAG: N-acetylglucosamine-6-phosphate deacetylase [Lachnospiraceae bacterium]